MDSALKHTVIYMCRLDRHKQVDASPELGVPRRGPFLHLAGWPHFPLLASWLVPPPLRLSLSSHWLPQCPSGFAAASLQSQSRKGVRNKRQDKIMKWR